MLLVTEAAVSGSWRLRWTPRRRGLPPDRFFVALVGSGVALAVHAILPSDPRQIVERAAHPIFDELVGALEETAAALGRAEYALHRARVADGRIGSLKEALAAFTERPDRPVNIRWFALEAVEEATAVLWDRNDLETSMVVGQIRLTAVDLLRASGMDSNAAVQALREAELNAAVAKAPIE